MSKVYKVSYKTYLNDRLKQVYLHGKLTYPLYVQVTFERKTLFFKSYYFELFSKPRYFLSAAGLSRGLSIEEIAARENEVIDFVINKHPNDFSLDLFKREYAFYSKDVCDIMEESFIDYMYTFFQDKGMPAFAVMVREGCRYRIAFDVVQDMKLAFTKPFFDELVESSLYYAPPYLPLYGFMQETKKWSMFSLTVMEWETSNTQTEFLAYLQKHYRNNDAGEIKKMVEKWLNSLRKIGK
ncbi:hypothetical protein [Emticicia sp. 21SJ11W-3]|uniref:hypothetical protein n=1 Tax=Emticicia sp. 21SJ11W-3 TaxID=2916755 RepID=UPI0020A01E62|nr:hypothetical protein [Emticicia sp. 21SJ11W-3]UTA67261.1 hypothetical protein MB380_16840 [Emticicia sp. 21SJ11W-3]